MRKSTARQLAGFLVPSIVGIMLFMIPIQVNGSWTVAVKVVADVLGNALGDFLPVLCVIIVTISAVLGLASLAKPSFITSYPIIDSTFTATPIWAIIRCIGAVFVWLTFLGVGAEEEGGVLSMITGPDAGGLILGSKIPVNILELFILFLERTIISLIIVAPVAHLIF